MQNYDPERPPNPAEWLALDEQFRIHLAEVYHRKGREKVPNLKAHAVFHAIVENQIAQGLEPVVHAMARVMKQGLSRHDAVHAVGSCVADHLFEAMNSKDEDFGSTAQARYDAAVERLTAQEWKRKYE
jgi:L-serine deaminase